MGLTTKNCQLVEFETTIINCRVNVANRVYESPTTRLFWRIREHEHQKSVDPLVLVPTRRGLTNSIESEPLSPGDVDQGWRKYGKLYNNCFLLPNYNIMCFMLLLVITRKHVASAEMLFVLNEQ